MENVEKSMKKITLNQIALTTVIMLILTLGIVAAASDNPKDAKDWYNKGVDLGRSGKFDEAIKAFDKTIELNTKNEDAWFNKGLVLCSFK